MFSISFTGLPDEDGRRKRLARTTVNTDSSADAVSAALAIVNKQTKKAQDAVGAIRITREEPGQKDVVFSVGGKEK